MLSGTDDPPLKAGAQQLLVCPKYGCLASSPQAPQALDEVGKDKSGPFQLPFGSGLWAEERPNYPVGVGQRCVQHPQPPSRGRSRGVLVKEMCDSGDGVTTHGYTPAHLPGRFLCGLPWRGCPGFLPTTPSSSPPPKATGDPLGPLCLLGARTAPPPAPVASCSTSPDTEPTARGDSRAPGTGYAV